MNTCTYDYAISEYRGTSYLALSEYNYEVCVLLLYQNMQEQSKIHIIIIIGEDIQNIDHMQEPWFH